MRFRALLCLACAAVCYAPWELPDVTKHLVLHVSFETAKDYDITSAYAVRGWNTTEGRMKITCPSSEAKHSGVAGLAVTIQKAFTENFHAQFSLPHFMPRIPVSAYLITFWGRIASGGPEELSPELVFLDVDEGYDWVGGARVTLTQDWQHIALDTVYTKPIHQGHEIQIAFLIGAVEATLYFDDLQLSELGVLSPPPPSPPPPPNYLLWLDGEGGPKDVQSITKVGGTGAMTDDLSSTDAAHEGKYGYEVEVTALYEKDYHGMISLPAFLVTDHERMYRFTFWAKATGNPKPKPHIVFQDEDNDYAYINGEEVQLTAFWHEYTVNLAVPYELSGHNVIINIMVGTYVGRYFFDDFRVSNEARVSPPPLPPMPPPSPPPNVLQQFTMEWYDKGSINSQAWPEGQMEVVVQSTAAAHTGIYGMLIRVVKKFAFDWHAQVSFKPWLPPDIHHGYVLTFWGRSSASVTHTGNPKVVFHDADDAYTAIKSVSIPMTPDWNMYQVDLEIPPHRAGHEVVINFWVGDCVGSYSIDDLAVNQVAQFLPPPPPPPHGRIAHPPPPPGVVALLGFEGTDDGLMTSVTHTNGTWDVSVPDERAAHNGNQGLYAAVSKPWGVAQMARIQLPRYVPRLGQETLLHLSFFARVEKLRQADPDPKIRVAFVDLHKNYEELGTETVTLSRDWQMHYVVIDLKLEHVGHSIRPYLDIGEHAGIYNIDDIEYKEIEIEDGMHWLQNAPDRIKQVRMGKFDVNFLDRDQWPIDYGTLNMQLVRHDFPIGVTLRTRPLSAYSAADYDWNLNVAAQHFWTGTLQKQMQWYEYEPKPGVVNVSLPAVEAMVKWAALHRWHPLSASLLDSHHSKRDHWSNKLACKDLSNRMKARIQRELNHFRGAIDRYEVWTGALKQREWIDRCGEDIMLNSFRWAHEANPEAELMTTEEDILDTLTLTNAEAFHNMVWRMRSLDTPIGSLGVRAHYTGEIDVSTLKHRLDVLDELGLPVYITELSIAGLEPVQHAYELEKFLRTAFSHRAVAGVTLSELWDKGASHPGSGLYAANKQPKPAATKMEELWKYEWTSQFERRMGREGVLIEGFYGLYAYELRSGERVCSGEVELLPPPRAARTGFEGYHPKEAIVINVQCDWQGHLHYPVWATPLLVALISVGCLMTCYKGRQELVLSKQSIEEDSDEDDY